MKTAYYSIAAAALLAASVSAANAQGVGTAISATAGAAYDKSAEGVNNLKDSYHQNMANSNADSAKKNLAEGDYSAAATDAKDAATHQSEAMKAKGSAAAHKTKASKEWSKAKAAVSTSSTTDTK